MVFEPGDGEGSPGIGPARLREAALKTRTVWSMGVLALLAAPWLRAAAFRASVVKVDITPDRPQWLLGYAARQSTGVHDRLYHRIVAMDDGRTQFFLVSSDICVVSPSEYDKVAQDLEKRSGISPLNFWWTLTHTHSAPELGPPGLPAIFMGNRYQHEGDKEYWTWVEQRLIDGVIEARTKLEPARIGAGWGLSMANINRRARDVEGEAFLGLNPDGPVDRRIGVLRIDRVDGAPLVLIANYAMHGTVLGGESRVISGDAPGVVSEYVEQKTGAPMLFINGAAGNIAPIYSVQRDPKSGRLGQFRVLLGDRILAANRTITAMFSEVTLRPGSLMVETPRKPGLGWPPDLGDYTRTDAAGTNQVRLPVRFLRINDDIAIWSAPLELFCEIAMEVRDRSPYLYTFYYGYGNGWLGYLPTEQEFQYGGYEPGVSPYTARAANDLTSAVTSYLEGR